MKDFKTDFSSDMQEALDCLRKGGVILYPTDTIWGIGCDARNSEAVKRIYNIKNRIDSKSMLVLVNNEKALENIIEDIPEITWDLLEVAANPLTIIYDKAFGIAKELIAKDGSVGVRISKESFSNELCKRLGAPIVSTSANISGEKSPSNFKEISDNIKNKVDYIVHYRQNEVSSHTPSNIIKLSKGGVIKIIR